MQKVKLYSKKALSFCLSLVIALTCFTILAPVLVPEASAADDDVPTTYKYKVILKAELIVGGGTRTASVNVYFKERNGSGEVASTVVPIIERSGNLNTGNVRGDVEFESPNYMFPYMMEMTLYSNLSSTVDCSVELYVWNYNTEEFVLLRSGRDDHLSSRIGSEGTKTTPFEITDLDLYPKITSMEVTGDDTVKILPGESSVMSNYKITGVDQYGVAWQNNPTLSASTKGGGPAPSFSSMTTDKETDVTFYALDTLTPGIFKDYDVTFKGTWEPSGYNNSGATTLTAASSVNVKHPNLLTIDYGYDGKTETAYGYLNEPFQIATESDLKRPGYTFTEWKPYFGGNMCAIDGNKFTFLMSSQNTVIAQWDLAKYTITFNTLGGNPISDLPYNIESQGVLPTPTWAGHRFLGWKAASNGGNWDPTIKYSAGTPLAGMYGDVTLEATWEDETYTVTLDYNDSASGSGVGEALDKSITKLEKVGVDDTLTLPRPERRGYRFAGWYDTPNKTGGTQYESGKVGGISKDTTLYARWELVDYTIRFDLKDGQLVDNNFGEAKYNPSTGIVTYDIEDTIRIPKAEKDGYVFNGWNVSLDEDTWVSNWAASDNNIDVDIDDTTGYTFTGMYGNIVLTAQGAVETYTVYFDNIADTLVGGKDLHHRAPMYFEKDEPMTAPADPVVPGYTFMGWFTRNGEEFVAGTACSGPETYYAKWEATSYTATFISNGATIAKKTYSIEESLVLDAPTEAGATFNGWTIRNNGGNWTETGILSAGTYKERYGEVTFVADWTTKEYTVSFDANIGNLVRVDAVDVQNPASQSVAYMGTITLPEAPANMAGYTFMGWYTAAAGGIPVGNAGTTVTWLTDTDAEDNTVVLYAQWMPKTYTATFVIPDNDGTIDENGDTTYEITYTIESGINTDAVYFPTATNTNDANDYVLVGWYTEGNAGHDAEGNLFEGTYIPGQSFPTLAYGDITFTAVWHNEHIHQGECKPAPYGTHTIKCTKCGEIVYENCTLVETTVTEVDCETDGIIETTCDVCGRYEKTNIPHYGHDWVITKVVPATCLTDGYSEHYCTRCEKYEAFAPVDKLNHKMEEHKVEPTCTARGYTEHYCTNDGCDVYYVDSSSYTDPTGHAWEETPHAATCIEPGFVEHTCSKCGSSYITDYTSATGNHDYHEKGRVPATNTRSGYILWECYTCHSQYKETIYIGGKALVCLTLYDYTGKYIPKAEITATNVYTGEVIYITTDLNGYFTYVFPQGVYELVIHKDHYQDAVCELYVEGGTATIICNGENLFDEDLKLPALPILQPTECEEDCLCHQTSIWARIYRIIYKLLKIFNPNIKCCADSDI